MRVRELFVVKFSRTRTIHTTDKAQTTASLEAIVLATRAGVERERILKIQASLTAHWHDKGADWRGLAHTQAHHRKERKKTSKPGRDAGLWE